MRNENRKFGFIMGISLMLGILIMTFMIWGMNHTIADSPGETAADTKVNPIASPNAEVTDGGTSPTSESPLYPMPTPQAADNSLPPLPGSQPSAEPTLPSPQTSAPGDPLKADSDTGNPSVNSDQANTKGTKAAEPSKLLTYKVTAYFLNVRDKPDAHSAIQKVVKQGDRLEAVGKTDNGWVQLADKGYVHGRYVQLVPAGSEQDANVVKGSASDSTIDGSAQDANAVPPKPASTHSDPDPNPAPDSDQDSTPVKPTSVVYSDSGLTPEHLAVILKGTALTGQELADAILGVEKDYGINAFFTIAVMKLESGNGKSRLARTKNNLFGLNAVTGDENNQAYSFKSKADSVRKFGKILSKSYVGKGYTTVEKVANKYCPASSSWASQVKNIMKSDYRKL